MITRDNMPKGYIPFDQLTICSNTIIGGGHILAMGNTIPIVLGQGTKPMIWLQAVANSKKKTFTTVVDASISKHAAVKVIEEEHVIKVSVGNTTVLQIQSKSEGSAVVDKLDLRPLGINLFGDAKQLTAGGATFSSSTFKNMGTIISFGE